MAVTLTITGLDPKGRTQQQSVPDGSTIDIQRTLDGFLFINVSAPSGNDAERTSPDAGHLQSLSGQKIGADKAPQTIDEAIKPGPSRDFEFHNIYQKLQEAPDLASAAAREIVKLHRLQDSQMKFLTERISHSAKSAAALAVREGVRAAETAVLRTIGGGAKLTFVAVEPSAPDDPQH